MNCFIENCLITIEMFGYKRNEPFPVGNIGDCYGMRGYIDRYNSCSDQTIKIDLTKLHISMLKKCLEKQKKEFDDKSKITPKKCDLRNHGGYERKLKHELNKHFVDECDGVEIYSEKKYHSVEIHCKGDESYSNNFETAYRNKDEQCMKELSRLEIERIKTCLKEWSTFKKDAIDNLEKQEHGYFSNE